MEIAVLVKPVPEGETRLRANAAGSALDTEGIKWVLAGYDESAVEQALLLKETIGGSRVRVLSYGPAPRTEEVLRAAIALGCDTATWVECRADEAADPLLVARALSAVLGRTPVDIVLTGKQAGDDECGLVAGAIGEQLQRPSFGSVTDLRWDAATSRFRFHRSVEGGVETVESPAPLVVGLQQAWNDPRTAKLPNILKSRKAPIERLSAATLEGIGSATTVSTAFRLPTPRTGAKIIDGKTAEDVARELVRILREEAKVFP